MSENIASYQLQNNINNTNIGEKSNAHIEEELENDVTVEFMKCNQCSYKIKWNRSTTPMLGMLHNKLISNKIPLSD